MQTLKGYFDLFNSAKATLFTIGVIIVAVLNLWLGIKLAPLATGVHTNTGSIAVIQADMQILRQECLAVPGELEAKLDKRFDSIEQNIKRIDDRNLDIYKILIER